MEQSGQVAAAHLLLLVKLAVTYNLKWDLLDLLVIQKEINDAPISSARAGLPHLFS